MNNTNPCGARHPAWLAALLVVLALAGCSATSGAGAPGGSVDHGLRNDCRYPGAGVECRGLLPG